MFELIIGLSIFVAILLMIVILAQNPKGGGLSSAFGGSGASQVMGVKKTGDLLEKLTWGFAIALVALTLASAAVVDTNEVVDDSSPNVNTEQQGTDSGLGAPLETIDTTETGLDDLNDGQ